jgi:hypothetical protein
VLPDESGTIQIPDFVVRQVGALQIQLAAANEEIARLRNEIAALRAATSEAGPPTR